MNDTKRYFLAQDLYSNWYAVPLSEKETWSRLMGREDAYNYDAWVSMEKYLVDITKLTFENPICR